MPFADFVAAYNLGKRIDTLKVFTLYEFIPQLHGLTSFRLLSSRLKTRRDT
jgi:hypothetical protein